MKKSARKLSRLSSLVVAICGIIVMGGWMLDITALKSLHPAWVTMKFSTALCFFLSGVTVFFIATPDGANRSWAQVVLPVTVLCILLLMATLLASNFVGLKTGVEDLFVREPAGAVKTTVPGRPSVGTMINFILIALAGAFALFESPGLKSQIGFIGWPIAALGGLAMSGYMTGLPILYYRIGGWSTAMALHTAILFVLLGAAIILSGRSADRL